MPLWRQSCIWGSVHDGVWSRCWRGWGRPDLPPCCFSGPVPAALCHQGLGLHPSLAPQQCPPLLALHSTCSSCFHDLAACPVLASRVQPTLHPQDKPDKPWSMLSLTLDQPWAVATPESRLPAAWDVGADTINMVFYLFRDKLLDGVQGTGQPAILERPVLITPPPQLCRHRPEHTGHSSRQETLATHSLGSGDVWALSRASTATAHAPGCREGPEPANVLAPDQPVWQTTGLPGVLLISSG